MHCSFNLRAVGEVARSPARLTHDKGSVDGGTRRPRRPAWLVAGAGWWRHMPAPLMSSDAAEIALQDPPELLLLCCLLFEQWQLTA